MNAGTGRERQRVVPHRSWIMLALFMAAFLLIRLPPVLHQPAWLDESYFAVPGWTILQDGVPRIPYMPSRNLEGVFYKADVAMFTLPPAYFYLQAAFYAVFGPSHGAARLASTAAGLVALWLVFHLGRSFYRDDRIALWAAGLFSLSRFFYFPCLFARPDMLCGAIGLGAIACTWSWHRSRRLSSAIAAGGLIGLGMLTHPFAIVYAMQIGVWVFFGSRGWRQRLRDTGLLVATAFAVFALWLPLIVAYPEVFRVQFFNNVLDRSGPGLLERLVFPWESLKYQSELLLEHAGPWQLALMGLALFLVTIHDLRPEVRRAMPGRLTLIVLAWSSIYLLIACQGAHPTKGYWCYPGAFLFLGVGRAAILIWDRLRNVIPYPRILAAGGSLILIAIMLPGAGLRATAAYVRHWSDPDYNSPRFVQRILSDLPADAIYLVDPAHVFEVYLSDRETLAAEMTPFSFDATGFPYDYLIASQYDLERNVPEELNATLVRTYGDRSNPFACYAELYRAPPVARPSRQ